MLIRALLNAKLLSGCSNIPSLLDFSMYHSHTGSVVACISNCGSFRITFLKWVEKINSDLQLRGKNTFTTLLLSSDAVMTIIYVSLKLDMAKKNRMFSANLMEK